MTNEMKTVHITGAGGEITTYRNVFPPSMEHETREAQAAEWGLTV